MSDRSDTIADELLALRSDNGRINPTDAVRWARRHTKSKLHSALEWDDEVAGERYRIWQVRSLISTYILDAGTGERRFVSLSIDRRDGGYRSVEEVMRAPDLRDVMVSDALAELERVQRRYDRVTELQAVWEEAAKVRQRRRPPAQPLAAE